MTSGTNGAIEQGDREFFEQARHEAGVRGFRPAAKSLDHNGSRLNPHIAPHGCNQGMKSAMEGKRSMSKAPMT